MKQELLKTKYDLVSNYITKRKEIFYTAIYSFNNNVDYYYYNTALI